MEFKRSFLSRLFGSKPEVVEEEEEKERLPPEPVRETQAKAPSRHILELSEDHAFHKLWSMYRDQTSWQPRPELALERPEDPILPDEVAKTELMRLQLAVNSSANKRYEQLKPKKKEPKEAESEPEPLPDLDAQATVFLSKSGMTAWLLIYPPVGKGKELDREILDQALEQQKVCYGLDQAVLDALPQKQERYFHLIPVAHGLEAVNGVDGSVEELFPRSQKPQLIVDEHNRVDYKNLDFIHNVEKGDPICRITLPTSGTPGRTVQDKEIPVKAGKPASAPQGRNTEISEDGLALVAVIAGHVEFSGRSFQVKPVMDIPGNVDFSVGNINFWGDVCIHGDVCSGFTVRATGSVTIDGVVEASTVEAGRDLVLARGIQGDNQAVIRAQGSVFAKFLENCSVYAKKDLETECIINCSVCCDGTVTVRTGHSKIIGGKIHSAHEVSAGIVGSRVGNRTNIILGGQPCEAFDYDLLRNEIKEMEETMERTSRQPDSPVKSGQMAKLRVQLMQNRSKLEAIEKERELRIQDPPNEGIRRMKCDTVYPGTILTIGEVVHHFDDVISPCCASLAEGEIQLI